MKFVSYVCLTFILLLSASVFASDSKGDGALSVQVRKDGMVEMKGTFTKAQWEQIIKDSEDKTREISVKNCTEYCVQCNGDVANGHPKGYRETICTGGWWIGPGLRAVGICGINSFQITPGSC